MENCKLMNMCKITDEKNNMVLIQKRIKSWRGLAFPGGKVELDESIFNSVIREVKEETNLEISDLKFCGIKSWYSDDIKNIVFLYKTSTYTGELLKETPEGENVWMNEKDIVYNNPAPSFLAMLEIFNGNFMEMKYDESIQDWVLY